MGMIVNLKAFDGSVIELDGDLVEDFDPELWLVDNKWDDSDDDDDDDDWEDDDDDDDDWEDDDDDDDDDDGENDGRDDW